MKKSNDLILHIFIFVTAQLAWFLLLGLWIYWYVTNYILLNKVGGKISPQIITGTTNIIALVSGIVLLVMLSISMSLIFVYLNRQLNLTRLYDNFIANVSHELKSPLSSIQLYLETMHKMPVPRDKQHEFLNLMLKDVKRLNHLINSILYLSSLEQKKMVKQVTYDYYVYNADSIIRQVIGEALSEFKFPGKSVSIEGHVDCQCVIDRNWLKIVIKNLIDNAVKYSPNKAQIDIRLSTGTKKFYIEFSDQGVGIAPRNQKKIFSKFERIYNPASPNVKGTGLGLYWVKQIVAYHGGKISVESAGLNRGTTFKIALPIYEVSKKRYINRLLRLSKKYKPAMKVSDE
ncbi:MAG TPA: HAMP domain-containing histidine kinase [Bacteroidetes bacterium]|nr:HAMP domain-containing histidine kinase [Bacteroidota bacterium]